MLSGAQVHPAPLTHYPSPTGTPWVVLPWEEDTWWGEPPPLEQPSLCLLCARRCWQLPPLMSKAVAREPGQSHTELQPTEAPMA